MFFLTRKSCRLTKSKAAAYFFEKYICVCFNIAEFRLTVTEVREYL
jgi:hypothetical protein